MSTSREATATSLGSALTARGSPLTTPRGGGARLAALDSAAATGHDPTRHDGRA